MYISLSNVDIDGILISENSLNDYLHKFYSSL